jgi:enoyl-CoA hydratase
VAVTQETRGRTLIVRVDREEKRNAINAETADGIDAALNRLDDEPGLWVGILTGTSTVFCAGTDIRDGAGPSERRRRCGHAVSVWRDHTACARYPLIPEE